MVILTPLPENETTAVETISRMWESCGATVVSLSVDHHDQVLAATSHLPHVLAYALVDCLAGMNEHDEIFRFSAGGFRDFTRIGYKVDYALFNCADYGVPQLRQRVLSHHP